MINHLLSFSDASSPVGRVISVDLLPIVPLPGAEILSGRDFTHAKTQTEILDMLNGRKVNSVISDMAPNATGVKSLSHELIIDLVLSALKFATGVLENEGHFLCKIWQGSEQHRLENILNKLFTEVNVIKPKSSRKESAEIFVLGKGFHGIGHKK